MRTFSRNMVSTSFIAVALSILTVGTVWASSAAFNDPDVITSTTDAPQDSGDEPTDSTVPSDNPEDKTPLSIDDLYEMVQALSEDIDNLEADRNEQALVITELEKSINKLSSQIVSTNEKVQTISDSVSAILPKLAKITVDGIYTGSITPAQLTRKFNTDEITGDWPLERTKGQLSTNSLKLEFGSCTPDSRSNVFLTVDPFRNITCLKILK